MFIYTIYKIYVAEVALCNRLSQLSNLAPIDIEILNEGINKKRVQGSRATDIGTSIHARDNK